MLRDIILSWLKVNIENRLSNIVKVVVLYKNGQWEQFDIYRNVLVSGVLGGHDIEKVMFTSLAMV